MVLAYGFYSFIIAPTSTGAHLLPGEHVDIAKTKGVMLRDINVVITHDWPSGIRNWKGTDLIRSLTETLEPQLHVCGHLHASHEAVIGKTTVHALDAVLGAKHGDDR